MEWIRRWIIPVVSAEIRMEKHLGSAIVASAEICMEKHLDSANCDRRDLCGEASGFC